MRRRPAELIIEPRVVDDVISGRAARRRLQIRRAVHVADAERGKVVSDGGSVVEGEAGLKLQPVGRQPGPARGLRRPGAEQVGAQRGILRRTCRGFGAGPGAGPRTSAGRWTSAGRSCRGTAPNGTTSC